MDMLIRPVHIFHMLDEYKRAEGITDTELAERLGVSQPYATRLKNRKPGKPLALKTALSIHAKIGVKVGPLENASDEEIVMLARITQAG